MSFNYNSVSDSSTTIKTNLSYHGNNSKATLNMLRSKRRRGLSDINEYLANMSKDSTYSTRKGEFENINDISFEEKQSNFVDDEKLALLREGLMDSSFSTFQCFEQYVAKLS